MLEAGDTAMARELFLQFEPGWLEPDQWGRLIRSDAELGCYMSWILINTGEPDQGKMLVDQTLNYLENDLPVITEHWDQYALDTCYLVAGETDKALTILEMQLEHGHIFFWKTRHQLPMYAPLYQEPAYRALLDKRDQWLAEQRELIATLDAAND